MQPAGGIPTAVIKWSWSLRPHIFCIGLLVSQISRVINRLLVNKGLDGLFLLAAGQK